MPLVVRRDIALCIVLHVPCCAVLCVVRQVRKSRYFDDFVQHGEIGGGAFSHVFKVRSRIDGWL